MSLCMKWGRGVPLLCFVNLCSFGEIYSSVLSCQHLGKRDSNDIFIFLNKCHKITSKCVYDLDDLNEHDLVVKSLILALEK